MEKITLKLVAIFLALFLVSHYGGAEARETTGLDPCVNDDDCVGKCPECAGSQYPKCGCVSNYCVCKKSKAILDELVV
ncbi:hypothetical protein LINPERPRIM_LOCUS27153 [Linum perenne]